MNENYAKIFSKYKESLKRNMKILMPELGDSELDRAIDWSMNRRIRDHQVEIDDNYHNQRTNINLIKLYEYIQERKPILTSYGCLFTQHGERPNPLYEMIQEFADRRNNFKKKMLQYPKGSEEYNRYNLNQLVAKVDTNAIYGCLGAASSVFYNVYVATSITRQGRSSITASIMLFESFLANNIKFGSLNQIVAFIDHVLQEKPNRKFRDSDILDNNVSKESVFAKLMLSCGYRWLPNDEDMEIIWRMVQRLDQEDLNRLYYKNNLYSFFDNEVPLEIVTDILKELDSPFIDPNSPPSNIQDKLDILVDIVKEYVYYRYQIIDKIERVETLIRQVDLTTDTDSCIITLNPWYTFIADKVKNEDMKIKHFDVDAVKLMEKENLNEAGDILKKDDSEFIYDFKNDEIVKRKRMRNPLVVIPEDSLRHSIINILAYVIGKLLRDYFDRISIMNNVTNEAHPFCLMNMKNEFLFMKMLLSDAKKHYATLVEVQEGHVIPNDPSKQLDIKGLEMDKSVIPKSTKEVLSKILYEDILKSKNIDQLKIINKLAVLEKQIKEAIVNGSTEYFKPMKVKSIRSYKNPMSTQQVKGSIIYDLLRDKNEPYINLDEQCPVLVVKTKINKSILESSRFREEYPDKYNLLIKAFYDNNSIVFKVREQEYLFNFFKATTPNNAREITSIAIPYTIPTPKWLIEFIDYDSIIKENIGAFPLESIGITKLDTNSAYSGIIQL